MLIHVGYDIQFDIPQAVAFVAHLRVHPSRQADLEHPDFLRAEPALLTKDYEDSFGNLCTRFVAPPGHLKLSCSAIIKDSGEPDPIARDAEEIPVGELPTDALRYLMSSRYCEVDLLSPIASDLFANCKPGWSRVQAICDWVHGHVAFDYTKARPTKTALDVYTERVGVCRDFQHLAITFCRAVNIPARYAAGYLGDIRISLPPSPMDFSAWFEVYLGGKWWTFDARHNQPRVGRVLMTTGRDAVDVAITTTFGLANLSHFTVISDELSSSYE
jgi:transglutaminase-like putative cysteine protease